MISSTDAAATFPILRRRSLRPRLASTIEIESAANDPMAILLTLVVVEALTAGTGLSWTILPVFAWKFVAGPVVGWLLARIALAIFDRLNPLLAEMKVDHRVLPPPVSELRKEWADIIVSETLEALDWSPRDQRVRTTEKAGVAGQ